MFICMRSSGNVILVYYLNKNEVDTYFSYIDKEFKNEILNKSSQGFEDKLI